MILIGYNKYMEIADFNKMLGQESENLAVKIFSETCCNGCTCQSSSDHNQDTFIDLTSDELL